MIFVKAIFNFYYFIRKDASPAASKLSSIEEVLPRLREQILEVFPHLKRAFLVFDEVCEWCLNVA